MQTIELIGNLFYQAPPGGTPVSIYTDGKPYEID